MGKKYRDAFGDRMKRYELVSDTYLVRRMPVIMRFDMVAGHTFTRKFVRPFDAIFGEAMRQTMLELCKSIPGCVFGYTQSDEITLILCDYKTLESDAWFDYRVQKLCAISACKAGRFFNAAYARLVEKFRSDLEHGTFDPKSHRYPFYGEYGTLPDYEARLNTADFDCRVFNVPKEDVVNNLLWRQRDAEKNSIQAVAQSFFSARELKGLKLGQLQDKLFKERGINWNDLWFYHKRGNACRRFDGGPWVIDEFTPVFSKQRDYIEECFLFSEE